MSNRNWDKKTLDEIGKKLIVSSSTSSGDIDKIVSDPQLFARIQNRIAADALEPKPVVGQSIFFFIRQNAASFAAVAMIVTAAIGGVSLLRSSDELIAATALSVPAETSVAARPDLPPLRNGSNQSPGRASNRDIVAEPAVVKQVSKAVYRERQTYTDIEPEANFYPVSFTADGEDTAGGERIIRVDMPRSSLFALGINVPLENGAEVVKADLLVGSDGVTRGIRVVK